MIEQDDVTLCHSECHGEGSGQSWYLGTAYPFYVS